MWTKMRVKLVGVAPVIHHIGQMADPTNEATKAIKKISGKRSKTDSDYEELARLEFQGALYMGEKWPVIPGFVLESCIVNGAKKSKSGQKAKSGMFVEENPYLIYDGPKDRDGLWANKDFRIASMVCVNRARICRTRPIFNEWELEFTINFDNEQTDKADVFKWLEDAGNQVGLCDWRPRYGRFTAELID